MNAHRFPRVPTLADVVAGRASLIGPRLSSTSSPGWASPLDPRLALGLLTEAPEVEEARRLRSRSLLADLKTLAMTAALRALGLLDDRAAPGEAFLVSSPIDNLSLAEALGRLLAPPLARARIVHLVHAHALNLAVGDAELASHLRRADLVLADGIGLRLGAALQGVRLRENLNGTDLLPILAREAARRCRPLILIGAAPGGAARAAERLRGEVPGLEVPLTQHGYLDDASSLALVEQLRQHPGAVVLVGMGTPVQERWVWRYLSELPVTVVTVGGLLDFASGRIPRAPQAWRELGVEWVYRLLQEPGRMAGRYLVGNPLFIARALLQRAAGPGPGAALPRGRAPG